MASAPSRGARIKPAADVRADYTRRIDELINAMAKAFQEIVQAAEVRDEISDARAEYQIEVEAANVAQQCEGLLRLISELKVACIAQDVSGMRQDAQQVTATLQNEIKAINRLLDGVGDQTRALLGDLEQHFYHCQSMLPVDDSAHPDDAAEPQS
mmetsp:Transcript_36297/g.88657  ORF Transcript_36297/g.88657 Transcript_36297/m.88657 type:complete len:155 (+) Transcript_36297:626-1090(+)